MGLTSKEQKWAIVAKWKETGSISATAKQLGESLKVVKKWVERYQATGDVEDAQRSGRPRLLDEAASLEAHDMLLGKEAGGAKSVARLLYTSGTTSKPVDRRTVTRAARMVANDRGAKLIPLRGKPDKRITEATRQKRLAFCKTHLTRNWSSTFFTDRSKFPFSHPGEKVHAVTWGEPGARREANTVNHAQVVNVYAGFCRYGMSKLHVVAGTSGHKTSFKNKKGQVAKNITHEEYGTVVNRTLLPEGQRIFSAQGIGTWTLQQDNDPTHKAAIPAVEKWNTRRASSISLLKNWPPNSPDLNPIENLWSYLKAKMDGKGCRTFKEYSEALHLEVKAIPTEVFSNLVDSMPRRMAACMALSGGKTRY